MRVIAGELKGKKLFSIKGKALRPTSDKVREAIFDILQDRLKGKRVLDLFAGTGALGIEALSRGAEKGVFVENNRHSLSVLRRNIEECRLKAKAEILACEVSAGIKILKSRGEAFELVFMDPPYSRGLVKETLQALGPSTLISSEALIIVEHSRREDLLPFPPFQIIDSRRYGSTCVSFLQRKDSPQKSGENVNKECP